MIKAEDIDLLSSIMQKKDVGDLGWHGGFNRRLEDTEKGATDDKR